MFVDRRNLLGVELRLAVNHFIALSLLGFKVLLLESLVLLAGEPTT
jgi:hypothetical protein